MKIQRNNSTKKNRYLSYNKNGDNMKKYLFAFLIAIVIGFFLSISFIKQYDNYTGIKVSGTGENLYFIQYGVFSSLESMEKETIALQNYVYSINDNMYYVYIGITKNSDNANKIVNYYKNLGHQTIIKQYEISNTDFLNELTNFDSVLSSTTDETVIASLINQTLIKYEEVVISGKN